eukprot:TRINITY_DN4415_c0_g1_i1.p1 TRINITY_DN4415_c0_g1~~TRINITY_DN4415_c0_g1_i1.p1  ORF type:complete len:293 (+),score=66.83 TRINITY_DN4415_c0_g1_i1:68-880(+)
MKYSSTELGFSTLHLKFKVIGSCSAGKTSLLFALLDQYSQDSQNNTCSTHQPLNSISHGQNRKRIRENFVPQSSSLSPSSSVPPAISFSPHSSSSNSVLLRTHVGSQLVHSTFFDSRSNDRCTASFLQMNSASDLQHFDGLLILFDLTNRSSFTQALSVLRLIKKYPSHFHNLETILVGNKEDLSLERQVDYNEIKEYIEKETLRERQRERVSGSAPGISYIEISVLERKNIELPFLLLTTKVLQKILSSSLTRSAFTSASSINTVSCYC